MKNKIWHDINHLIKLINLATPDSLNIANAVINKNQEIDIPQLRILREAVFHSLKDKRNRQLSQSVREIKKEIVENLTAQLNLSNPDLNNS